MLANTFELKLERQKDRPELVNDLNWRILWEQIQCHALPGTVEVAL